MSSTQSTPTLEEVKVIETTISLLNHIIQELRTDSTSTSLEYNEAARKERARLIELVDAKQKSLNDIRNACEHQFRRTSNWVGRAFYTCDKCGHFRWA